MTRITTRRALATALCKGVHPADARIRKEIVSTITQIGERTLRYVISNETVDRSGDVIALDGWDLTNFRRNPVVLWAHRDDRFPIGRAIDIGVEDGALKATVEFAPADIPYAGDHAEAAFRLSSEGFLPAVSVGFRPIEFDLAADRMDENDWMPPIDYRRQELLEFSLVSVPCNPDALLELPDSLLASPDGVRVDNPDEQQMRAAEEAVRKAELTRIARARRARRAYASIL